jgi:hypothetical protein
MSPEEEAYIHNTVFQVRSELAKVEQWFDNTQQYFKWLFYSHAAQWVAIIGVALISVFWRN